MLEAQKQEAAEASKRPASKSRDQVPIDATLDPILARLTPEERVVGWQYRFVFCFPLFERFRLFSFV